MADIIEIRWHGRGGQGAKTASEVLAEAVIRDGKFIQSFPEYGPERMGAPVQAYNRLSDERIDIHSNVYNPDYVVVLDPTLLESGGVTDGLREDGALIVNTDLPPEKVKEKMGFKGKVFGLDAYKIAREEIGRPMANTPCLGALIKATGITNLDNVKEALRRHLGSKLSEKVLDANIRAIERAYKEVKEA